MIYEPQTITIHQDSGGLYADVSFWRSQDEYDAGDVPIVREDFIFPNLVASADRVERDGSDHWKRIRRPSESDLASNTKSGKHSTITVTLNNIAATDVLVVCVGWSGSNDISHVKSNIGALSPDVFTQDAHKFVSSTGAAVYTFGAPNYTGTQTITATFAGLVTDSEVVAFRVIDADTTTPVSVTVATNGSGTLATLSPVSQGDGDTIYGCCHTASSSAHAVFSSFGTEIADVSGSNTTLSVQMADGPGGANGPGDVLSYCSLSPSTAHIEASVAIQGLTEFVDPDTLTVPTDFLDYVWVWESYTVDLETYLKAKFEDWYDRFWEDSRAFVNDPLPYGGPLNFTYQRDARNGSASWMGTLGDSPDTRGLLITAVTDMRMTQYAHVDKQARIDRYKKATRDAYPLGPTP